MRFSENLFGFNTVELDNIADQVVREYKETGETHFTVEKDFDFSEEDKRYLTEQIKNKLEA